MFYLFELISMKGRALLKFLTIRKVYFKFKNTQALSKAARMHWNGLTQSSVTTFPIAGPWHCGRWQDHIGRVLGLLQRHLRLHRPGRLFWPDGQECVETLNCCMLLPRYSCLWNHASRRNQLLLSNIVKSVAHQWTPHIMIINRNYSARKNEVYCAVECIMEYDKYTWKL